MAAPMIIWSRFEESEGIETDGELKELPLTHDAHRGGEMHKGPYWRAMHIFGDGQEQARAVREDVGVAVATVPARERRTKAAASATASAHIPQGRNKLKKA